MYFDGSSHCSLVLTKKSQKLTVEGGGGGSTLMVSLTVKYPFFYGFPYLVGGAEGSGINGGKKLSLKIRGQDKESRDADKPAIEVGLREGVCVGRSRR